MTSDHFQGKDVLTHLREARTKGALAASEVHGVEMSGHLAAGADGARETAIAFTLLWILLQPLQLTQTQLLFSFIIFSSGWLLWKSARSALLGWARLERLHRLIEEERWEIQHHRQQEREELTELYRAKGFSGKLLDEVIDVLMADDNRLLRVMLEEELGLTLEAYEHPLKQSAGAAIGVLATSMIGIGTFWVFSSILPALGLSLVIATAMAAKLEKNRVLPAVIWSLGASVLAGGVSYFITQTLTH